MVSEREQDWAALHDPLTDAAHLARIAESRPEFAAQIAAHPNAYPQLVAWARGVAPGVSPGAGVVSDVLGSASTHPAADAGTPVAARGRVLWLVVLGLFVVGSPLVAVLWNLDYTLTEGDDSRGVIWAIVEVLPYVGLLVVCLLAARSVGRAIGGAVCALGALLLAVLGSAIPYDLFYGGIDYYTSGGVSGAVVGVLIAALAFLAWGIAAPLRGGGYAALAILLPVTLVWNYLTLLLSQLLWQTPRGEWSVVQVLALTAIPAAFLLIVVWCATAWSRGSERRAARRAEYPRFAPPVHAQAYGAYASGAPGVAAYNPYALPAAQRTNTMAVLSLVFAFFIALLAVIFGHIALGQINRTGEGGRGMAVAGLVLGYIGLVAGIALTIGLIVWSINGTNGY